MSAFEESKGEPGIQDLTISSFTDLLVVTPERKHTTSSRSLYQGLRDAANCPICYGIISAPVQFLPCGHFFCKKCVTRLRATTRVDLDTNLERCPLCNHTYKRRQLQE